MSHWSHEHPEDPDGPGPGLFHESASVIPLPRVEWKLHVVLLNLVAKAEAQKLNVPAEGVSRVEIYHAGGKVKWDIYTDNPTRPLLSKIR